MQKLSLKVLLRFLGSYTHWNLVRRADCYHLYFVTKDSVGVTQLPTPRWQDKGRKARRRGSKLTKNAVTDIVPMVKKSRALSVETPTPNSTGKDVFLFSPIFESPEQAVAEGLCGLEQTLEERSKRSSLTSLVWDDECDFTTPYREEEDLEGYESGSSYTTIEESESRESTPREADDERAYLETSVRRQGDRLLRDMLQLRRDIEMDLNKEGPKTKEEQQGAVLNDLSDLESTPGLEVGKAEENMLRERLEMMTQQIKQEMAEELQKEKLKHRKSVSVPSTTESTLNNSDVVINGKGDVNASVDEAQMNGNGEVVAEELPGHIDVKNSDDGEPLLTPNGHFEAVTEITEKEAESEERICPASNIVSGKTDEDEICGDTKSKTKAEATTESGNNGQHIIVDELAPHDGAPENLSVQLADEKKLKKSRTPSVKVDTLKRKKKLKKANEKPTIVEIPFCSHSQHLTGQDQATFIECMEPKKAKPQLHTVLSPADRLGAEQILHELIEIRDGKSQKEKDPVLDTMISVIQLSSTNLSLPAPSVGGGGVQFKELFDFEVNFSESREAFAKLSGDGKHTVQELFPWTTGSGDTRQDAAVGCNKEDVFKKLRAGIQPR